jgi:hypothetical protein
LCRWSRPLPRQLSRSRDSALSLSLPPARSLLTRARALHDVRAQVSFHDNIASHGPRVFFESEDKVDGRACVSGSFTLSECHCEDFDLSVRFPKYNKGNQLNFFTGPKTFYLLRQLQDALHLVETASDLVAELSSSTVPHTRQHQRSPARRHRGARIPGAGNAEHPRARLG